MFIPVRKQAHDHRSPAARTPRFLRPYPRKIRGMASPDIPLGRAVDYPRGYDPALLFPIPRAHGRAGLGLGDNAALPFVGKDRWHAYELGWLDAHGKPVVATATINVPAQSPQLIESKSLKLYLNSLNAARFDAVDAARERIARDLSQAAGAPVEVAFGLPPMVASDHATSIDAIEVDCDVYDMPQPAFLAADATDIVDETLRSDLLKSNCPVTGQPDWARIVIDYHGPKLDRAGLLRYLVSFREHAEFHEQCVERIFVDVLARCAPRALSVEARYTRRGGLDINPWRTLPGMDAPAAGRDLRQ
jgi:7-cyano-7-deazaguanine reductase